MKKQKKLSVAACIFNPFGAKEIEDKNSVRSTASGVISHDYDIIDRVKKAKNRDANVR